MSQTSTNPFKPQQLPPQNEQNHTQNDTYHYEQQAEQPPQHQPPRPPPPDHPINQPVYQDTQTIVKPHSLRHLFRHYWQEAITYWAVFGTFGMCVAFLGPTLLDIGCLISSGLQLTTWAFTSQLFSSLVGASVAGYVVERLDANLVLFVNTCLVPTTMFLLPFTWNIWSLIAVLALMGVNMGFIDCIANLQMFKVFGDSVAPFLHAMHFFYGIGAFFSPVISEPYLLNEDCTPFLEQIQEPGLVRDNQTGLNRYVNVTDEPAKTLEEAQEMTQVRYAFWFMAGLQALVAILVFLLAHKMRRRGWTPAHHEINQSESTISEDKKTKYEERLRKLEISNEKVAERKAFMSEKHQILFITVASAALLFIYDGLQSAFGGYIYAYSLKSIVDLNKTEGAYLNALYWGMFALGRLVSIFLAIRFTPTFMLLCNIVGCMLSMTTILLLRHSHVILYIGTAVFGLFLSSVTPSTISMVEQYIDINARITSVLVVVGACGEMVFPNIVGNLFARVGPASFLIFCCVVIYMSIIIYASAWIVGRSTPKHLVSGSSFVWCHHCAINKQQVSIGDDKKDDYPMSVQNHPDSVKHP